MRHTIAGFAMATFTLGLLAGVAPAANAAPISCPAPQTATHDGGHWYCEGPSGNETNAEDTNNPNTKKWRH